MQPKIVETSRAWRTCIPLHPDSLHDLASPANQISTAFELYLMRRKNQPSGQDTEVILDLIQTSIGRLQRNLDALRKCSAIAESPCDLRKCDANELADTAASHLQSLIRDSEARVVRGELGSLVCDPKLITLAFTNLIENALRFRSEARPEVRIEASNGNGERLFSVSDNGIGIDSRHHETIFHVLKRVNGDRYPGLGTGLAVTRELVQRHGGRIWVESVLGNGSVFFFALPAETFL